MATINEFAQAQSRNKLGGKVRGGERFSFYPGQFPGFPARMGVPGRLLPAASMDGRLLFAD